MHEITLEQAAEKAFQAEIICRLLEDYPHELNGNEVSAVATILRSLSGNVSSWLEEEKAQQQSNTGGNKQ